MAQRMRRGTGKNERQATRAPGANGSRHEHRTAKVVELMATSTRGFEDAVENGIKDASDTTRGITGAHIENMSVKCENGKIVEYKVNMKIAFGIERTRSP